MTRPEQSTSSTDKPESNRPSVDTVFETLLGSGNLPQEGKP